MNLPFSWVKDFVNIDCNVNEFADAMTLSGSKVEAIHNKGKEISNVVVCKILEIEKHPDADKLFVVQADIGKEEPLQIVTAATNLFVGAYVPVALDGATLFNNLKIKKSKLRGVVSNGMFCSIEEFGFTKSDYPEAPENGIYIFEKEQPLGACVKEILQIDEDVVEFEITSNRADCFSIIGLAREASATLRKPLNYPKIQFDGINGNTSEHIKINVENEKLCKRYTCRVINNVKIKPSPLWLRHRLTAVGIRPINNIVDITNYVMLELGQPLHAYDLSKICGNQLTIRNSLKGEKLTTLDGVERTFENDVLVIQDKEKIVDLAGIMGGQNSMINDETTTVLLESANFDGDYIRLASKQIGLRTDASTKYEKGIDPNLALVALDRACQLIEMLECGQCLKECIDIYPNKFNQWEVEYSFERINKLLGTSLSSQEIVDLLALLEISSDGFKAKVPTFRTDIQNEADLAEEVARLFGYDNIQETLSTGTPTVGKKTYKQTIVEKITNNLISSGLNQSLTYSFESPKVFSKLNIPDNSYLKNVVTISNPLGEDFSIMRTTTLNAMLNAMSINYNRRNKEAFLFEIGKVYLPKELPLKELPTEKELVSVAMYGEIDFYDLKGIFENIFAELGMTSKIEYSPKEDIPFMHPTRTAEVTFGNDFCGYLGEVHPCVLDNYSIGTRVYYGILEVEKLVQFANLDFKYKELPKFPAIQRDIAVILEEDINVKEIEKVIKQNAGNFLEKIDLFDIYTGDQIEKGYKSVAYSIFFRSGESTLTDEQIEPFMKKIISGLETKLNAKLRDK